MESKCWGRNNQINDSDADVINLYYTGAHYDWLSKNSESQQTVSRILFKAVKILLWKLLLLL